MTARILTPGASVCSGSRARRERHRLIPDVLVVPLLGFDRAYFRLGYGGGYYDRTLAATTPRPLTIGVASADAELHTIYPQPHDSPMDVLVTERFILRADGHTAGPITRRLAG